MCLCKNYRRASLINPKDSPLCGMCKKVVNCPCECHFKNIARGYHEHIFSTPFDAKIRKEKKPSQRLDYIMMKDGKIPKTLTYRIRNLLRL